MLKVKRSMDKIKAVSCEELPTVKVLERAQDDDSTSVTYQSAEINRYELAIDYIKSNRIQCVEAIEACLLKRLKSQARELELLAHAITILFTHGWEHYNDSSFSYTALNSIC